MSTGLYGSPLIRIGKHKIGGVDEAKIVGPRYWWRVENCRSLEVGIGYKSKLTIRSGVRFYLAKGHLRRADKDLGPARELKRGGNPAGS